MLQKLNERIQGIIAWVVIILIVITFSLFGIEYFMQTHQDTSVQVEINGQPITKQAFELSYWRTRQLRETAHLKALKERQLKKQVLDDMILNAINIQAAKENGFDISPSQAQASIVNIPQFQKEGHFSTDQYQHALSSALFTPESFQKEVRQGMLLNQQRFAFIATSFALPQEIDRFVHLTMQTRDYDYAIIPLLPFIKSTVVSEQEINQYYNQHKREFVAPEQVSIDYIILSTDDIKKTIKPSADAIQRYYEENYGTHNDKPLSQVKADIEAQLANDLAQTSYAKTLEQVADLSYQTPDSLNPVAQALKLPIQQSALFSRQGGADNITQNKKIINAAFSHDVLELGNNSEPIQLTNDSVVVLRVKKHIPISHQSLDAVKSDIAHTLSQEKSKVQAKQLGDALLAESEPNHSKTMQEHHLKWNTITKASRDTDKAPNTINNLAFQLSVNKSSGTYLDTGDYVIVRLKKINQGQLDPADKEQLASISQQLETNYGMLDYDLYINSLLKQAKIVKY